MCIYACSNNGCAYTCMKEWEVGFVWCFLAKAYILTLFCWRHKEGSKQLGDWNWEQSNACSINALGNI